MHFLRRSCTSSTRGEQPGKAVTPQRLVRPASPRAGKLTVRSWGRFALRVLWLTGEVVWALLDFIINVVFRPKLPLARARAIWLQQTCRTALGILNVEIRTDGTIPLQGLLVCRQLSYLDVLAIGAITPTIFVSRSEIKQWPLFGWFGSLAGTLFVRSRHRSEIARLNREMELAFEGGNLVVLFPDRKTSDTVEALPFKSSLLEPATRLRQPLCAASISYSSLGASPRSVRPDEAEESTPVPPWYRLLSGTGLVATVHFDRLDPGNHDRKQLARRLRHHVRPRRSATAPVAG